MPKRPAEESGRRRNGSGGDGAANAGSQGQGSQQAATVAQIAAKFARTSSSLSSSTPTGQLRHSSSTRAQSTDGLDGEEWPGPFATAISILRKRQNAASAAQANQQASSQADQSSAESGSAEGNEEADEDMYDLALKDAKQSTELFRFGGESTLNTITNPTRIESLVTLCAQTISSNIDEVNYELDRVGVDLRDSVVRQLARQNKFNSAVALQIARSCSGVFTLPDCSQIDEEGLLQCLAELNEDSSATALQISLVNCGRAFSNRVAETLAENLSKRSGRNKPKTLESLHITGCYKLSDKSLLRLLSSCAHSLTSLDLSFNNQLGRDGIAGLATIAGLRTLVLDQCTHLSDDDLLALCGSEGGGHSQAVLPRLAELSLAGLVNLTDQAVCAIIEAHGERLGTLRLSECLNLTSATIVAVRSHCKRLDTLVLKSIGQVDTATWLGLFVVHNGFQSRSHIGALSHVDLSGNMDVEDDVVIALCEGYARTLTRLHIGGCHKLTNRSLAALIVHEPKLVYLDVSYLRSLSADVLTAMSVPCESLNTVALWGNAQLQRETTSALSGGNLLLWNNGRLRERGVQWLGRPKVP